MAISGFMDFEVKVAGTALSDERAKQVLEIVVDSNAHLPAMCTVCLSDPDFALVDSADFDIGKELQVSIEGVEAYGSAGTDLSLEVVFKGEITALEPEFRPTGSVLLVRGYDKSHRLHRGKKTRTFLTKKDSDIASTIAGEAGLSAQVDATTITYDYLLQNNQTNMEFLQTRARRIGYQVYSYNGNLYFKKGSWVQTTGALDLTWGTNLLSFRPRMTAVQQHDKASAYGWDPKTKAVITAASSAAPTSNQGGITDTGGDKAKAKFGGSAEANVTTSPLFSSSEATLLAQAVEDGINSQFVQAEGSCLGSSKVMAGAQINIIGVGTKFSGKYVVTEATHSWRTDGMYQVHFLITGRQPYTVSNLVQPSQEADGRVRGVVIGVVTNLNDPDDYGRVKVKFPWLPKADGVEIESAWCRIAAPMAGPTRGFYFLPEVNDEVLVSFEHGDPSYPYVVGFLWNKTEKPPLAIGDAVASGKVKQRMIKSTSGHVIILDDTQGSEKITIRDKTGKNEVVIDSASNTMSIKVEKDMTIDAKGAVTIKTSGGDMTLEANNVNVKAKQAVKVEATSTMNLKAMSSVTVEGTAGVTIKNVAAEIALSGPTINMNKGALEVM
jgi:Rhs element Vgr protein